jgi:hypothetical protein
MITIIFEEAEARALVGLIDMACKAGGLQVAEACVVLTKKIEAASKEAATMQRAANGGDTVRKEEKRQRAVDAER